MSAAVEYLPTLVEKAVMACIENSAERERFFKARESLYLAPPGEGREPVFRRFFTEWFSRLALDLPLREALVERPKVEGAVARFAVVENPGNGKPYAELFDDSKVPGRHIAAVYAAPSLLADAGAWKIFLRRELLYLEDMVDPQYGYSPDFGSETCGPLLARLLRERYGILWEITVAGRLCLKGWLGKEARPQLLRRFLRTFPGVEAAETAFGFFFDRPYKRHAELVQFVLAFHGSNGGEAPGSLCSLCGFPSAGLTRVPGGEYLTLRQAIGRENPAWDPSEALCPQCVDLYRSRIGIPRRQAKEV